MVKKSSSNLSKIPSVEKVKQTPGVSKLLNEFSDVFVTGIVRGFLEEMRSLRRKSSKGADSLDLKTIASEIVERVHAQNSPPLRRAINGTGIVIHTNLGRSMIGPKVADSLKEAATRYCNLEINLETGERGQRDSLVEPLICALTGA